MAEETKGCVGAVGAVFVGVEKLMMIIMRSCKMHSLQPGEFFSVLLTVCLIKRC